MAFFRKHCRPPRNRDGITNRIAQSDLEVRDEGTAALELAILLPILLFLLMGIMEFGYAFYVKNTLTNAVREGARVGVTVPETTNVENAASMVVTTYLDQTLTAPMAATAIVTVTPPSATDYLTVRAVIPNYRSQTPFNLLPDNLLPDQIAAQAVMRWEWALPGT